jgi:prepilin-type N-terminal cleavage/methylation domain-containing protein
MLYFVHDMPIHRNTSAGGFSLVELLMVLLVIGLLSMTAIFSLNNSRKSSRDAQRVSDIGVIRSALEQYWITNASYPSTAVAGIDLGKATDNSTVLTSNGFQSTPTGVTYLNKVPVGPKASEYYHYTSTISTGYAIRFTTELTTPYGVAGTYYAHSNGVDQVSGPS